MKILLSLILCLLLAGCGAEKAAETLPSTIAPIVTEPAPTTAPETEPPDPIEELMQTMTVQERVGQLFLARCSDASALQDIEQYHLGGFVLFGGDFKDQTPGSMRSKLYAYQSAAQIPLLLAVDEEGGTVNRVSRYPAFRSAPFPSPRDAYDAGGLGLALIYEDEKCRLLYDLGLNVNLAPVCDIAVDPGAFMYKRSLGRAPETTGEFIAMTVELMQVNHIGSCLKHFPGYGSNADTHVGIARDTRSLEELEGYDLIPFSAGIQAGCGAILVSHTIVEALDSRLPASLSPDVHQYLRENMGFDGVILTDDLVMDAITDQYGAGEAAVMAVLAGNDLLCSTDYPAQYQAVLAAVEDGRIDMELLNRAVRRVLSWKMELGLFEPKSALTSALADSDFVKISDLIPNATVELRYATTDNFTGQQIYGFTDACLRYGTAFKLKLAAEELAEYGYFLKIWDAFRPVSAQFRLWEVYPDANFVANPNVGYSSHSRGNTIDLTLVDASGEELEMPSPFDDFSAFADRDYSDCTETAAQNARLLQETMEKYGFSGYFNEWWHFSDTTKYPVEETFTP